MTRKGFTISEMLIVMVIIGIITAVTIPMFTIQKKMKDMEVSSLSCARTENAADLNTPACASAVAKAQFGKENAINTLAFLVNNGISVSEKTAASKILKQACDNGGRKACEYFVTACQKDSNLCNTADEYDLKHYLDLIINTDDISKFLIYDQTKALYEANNTNIRNTVNQSCCATGNINLACYVIGETECPYALQYGGNGIEAADAIEVAGDFIYVTGSENSDVDGGGTDIFVMKLNKSDGTVVWKNQYGGANTEVAVDLIYLNEYIYITGKENSDAEGGNNDILVMKINPADGSVLWKNQYGGINADTGTSIVAEGNFLYITGTEMSDGDGGSTDIVLLKINKTDGSIIWKNQYGGSSADAGSSLVIFKDYIYITGVEMSDSDGGSQDIFVMKVKEYDGRVVWKNQYGGTSLDYAWSIAILNNYLYVNGSEMSDSDTNAFGQDTFIMKLNAGDGTVVWNNQYGYTLGSYSKVLTLSEKYIYCIGSEMIDSKGGNNDIAILKIDQNDGRVVWKNQYGGINGEYGNSITYNNGYLYATGYESSDIDGNSADIFVMKINENQTLSNIDEWTLEGTTLNTEIIDEWTLEGTTLNTEIITNGTGWSLEGIMLYNEFINNWALEGTTLDTEIINEWALEGTTLDTEIINEWALEGTILDTEIITKGANGWTIGLRANGIPGN